MAIGLSTLPAELVLMVAEHLRPRPGDSLDEHRAAQNGLASLRVASPRMHALVPRHLLYRFPLIKTGPSVSRLISFLCCLRSDALLLGAVTDIALDVWRGNHEACRRAFDDHLGPPYLAAARRLVLHSDSGPSNTDDYHLVSTFIFLVPHMEVLATSGVSPHWAAFSWARSAQAVPATLRRISLRDSTSHVVELLLEESRRREPDAWVRVIQSINGSFILRWWPSAALCSRGPALVVARRVAPGATAHIIEHPTVPRPVVGNAAGFCAICAVNMSVRDTKCLAMQKILEGLQFHVDIEARAAA